MTARRFDRRSARRRAADRAAASRELVVFTGAVETAHAQAETRHDAPFIAQLIAENGPQEMRAEATSSREAMSAYRTVSRAAWPTARRMHCVT